MQKNEYEVALEVGGIHEWRGDKTAFTFVGGMGVVMRNGKIIYQRITPSKFAWGIEPILALEAKEAFDKTFKSEGNAYIRLY